MAIINCEECSKEMSDSASVCPHCGHTNKKSVGFILGFGIFLFPIIFSWFTLRKGHSTLSRIVSFAWLIFGLAFFSIPQYSKNTTVQVNESSYTATEATDEVMLVNIQDILSAYEKNEVGADLKYKGKTIQITGRIDEIKKDLMDNLYVTLGTGREFEIPQIQAFFDDKYNNQLATLEQGRSLTVICTIDGLMMNVLANDCVIK